MVLDGYGPDPGAFFRVLVCARGEAAETSGIDMLRDELAYDEALIGIDADFTVHVAPALLAEKDGPMLELLKVAHREQIVLPRRAEHYPNRELLAERFERFSQ